MAIELSRINVDLRFKGYKVRYFKRIRVFKILFFVDKKIVEDTAYKSAEAFTRYIKS